MLAAEVDQRRGRKRRTTPRNEDPMLAAERDRLKLPDLRRRDGSSILGAAGVGGTTA